MRREAARSWRLALRLTLLLALFPPAQAAAQAPQGDPPGRPAAQASVPPAQEPLPISPGGAFLRSVLVPGWGHVAIGSYTRGGFYFAAEAMTAYAFLRTRTRLSEARSRSALRESVIRSRLAEAGITDFEEIEMALDQDETLSGFNDLVDSRKGQQEDLIAWGLFLLFLSGADAYVSTHLGRFPEPIQVDVTPVDSDRTDVSLRIALPNFP